MKQILILSIFLPSYLLATTPKPELKPVSKEPANPTISKEVAPGINIHLSVANSHDVDNKNSAEAANIQGQRPTQVIHHIITIKKEESLVSQLRSAFIPAIGAGILSQVPFGKMADLAKDSFSRIDGKKVMNFVFRRG